MPVYATPADLAEYTGEAAPADAERLLRDASDLLDTEVLLTAVYDVDDDALPTDADVIEAFRDAVCAQIQYWDEVGEESDIGGAVQGASIGSVNLQYGAGANRITPTVIGPRVARIVFDGQ